MKNILQKIAQLTIMLVVIFIISSCKKDNSTTTPTVTPLAIGQTYQGGKIAYILVSGDAGYDASTQHGLIAAPSDTLLKWISGTAVVTGATDTLIGSGNANTNTIVSVQGTGTYAAEYCSNLVLGGYSDWYLPSKAELFKLYINKSKIDNFTGNAYWTSSESDINNAYIQGATDGHQGTADKLNPYSVRAIRSF